ncbi:DNA-directed RNA polymerases I and III subunit rpac1-like isoform X2 [Capsicum annuum]|uniref:DNA-directed RNA polymerases I and III subunit rpac1-like isoform X2 n=1 Tax=Capsicum annuum TaxID=4072 RepID=UPI0007BFB0FF|nr:DNA-directed RNA polymerases I and III subunit rpac1-like isoform X2 [Capsicum annuum]
MISVLSANNTSIIQDEVLAHKLGLIPIKVDPRLFEYMSENDVPNEKNTIVFKLNALCKKGSQRLIVLSSELKWLPNSSELILATESPASYSITKQKTYTSFSSSQDTLPEFSNYPIAPKDVDIIIAKHGPGQEIELEAHVVKDIGMTHAKWSPVATAKYGVLPKVVFLRDIEDDEAETFVKKCPIKVFDMEDIGKGKKRATVARPRVCTLSRECIREEGWDKNVAMRRVNGHII